MTFLSRCTQAVGTRVHLGKYFFISLFTLDRHPPPSGVLPALTYVYKMTYVIRTTTFTIKYLILTGQFILYFQTFHKVLVRDSAIPRF